MYMHLENSTTELVHGSDGEAYYEPCREKRRSISSVLFQIAIGSSIFACGVLIGALGFIKQPGDEKSALSKINTYSPVLDELPISFSQKTVNGSLFNDPFQIYKAEPSDVVDDAWEALSHVSVFAISSDAVRKMEKDPGRTVRVPEEWGYGSNKHLAQMDGQHLLHCLDSLRKYAHYDYYYLPKYGPSSNLPPLQIAHRSHCLGVLLESLTCQPSLNVITFDWMETQHNPFPDFNIQRKCVDWEGITEYLKNAELPGFPERHSHMERPKDAVQIPVLKQLAELSRLQKNETEGSTTDHDHHHR